MQQQQEEPGAHFVFRDEESCSSSCTRQHVHATAAPYGESAIRIRIERFLGWSDTIVDSCLTGRSILRSETATQHMLDQKLGPPYPGILNPTYPKWGPSPDA